MVTMCIVKVTSLIEEEEQEEDWSMADNEILVCMVNGWQRDFSLYYHI